jgi:hypothetical protein
LSSRNGLCGPPHRREKGRKSWIAKRVRSSSDIRHGGKPAPGHLTDRFLILEDAASSIGSRGSKARARSLADRVYVMSAAPGRIKEVLDVPFPKPRTIDIVTMAEFVAIKDHVLRLIRSEFQASDRRAFAGTDA